MTGLKSVANECNLLANGTNGGYSFATVGSATETGDVFNANGFTYTVNCVEHVNLSNGAVTGVVCNDGTGGNGIVCDRCSNTTFSGNTVNGFLTTAAGYGLSVQVSNTINPNSVDNTISNNVIIFPTGGVGKGIWEQCNAAAASCKNNTYTANHVLSDNTVGAVCLLLERDNGTFSNQMILGNSLINCNVGFQTSGTMSNVGYLEGITVGSVTFNDTSNAVFFPLFRRAPLPAGAGTLEISSFSQRRRQQLVRFLFLTRSGIPAYHLRLPVAQKL